MGRGARIVNVDPRGAHRGGPDAPAYGATKVALHPPTRSLAPSLGPPGGAVSAVAPDFVAPT